MRRPRFVGLPFVGLGIGWVVMMGLALWLLWNALLPAIFALPAISYWQALGLFLLSRVLFGRFGGWGRRMARSRMPRGWHDLTPDERERFRRAMGSGFPEKFREGGTEGKA